MNRVIHFDIPADDPERASKFYQEVFGWTIQKWNGPMEYWLVMTGPKGTPGIDGGIGKRSEGGTTTMNTIEVASLEDAIASVVAHGGKMLYPPMPVQGVGTMAVCQDTEGNKFGLMQFEPGAMM